MQPSRLVIPCVFFGARVDVMHEEILGGLDREQICNPADLFPRPGDPGWPVACNPRTAPPSWAPDQSEVAAPR